jgi:SAM-dependent methyltransferase
MPEFDIGYPHGHVQRIVPKGFRTIRNRITAFELDREYYDGTRENGYGGYRYDGRWKQIIPLLAQRYDLTSSSRILDVGCKKGFFLHDLKEIFPGITVRGVENHPYPLDNCMESVRADVEPAAYQALPFLAHSFDFVMAFASIYMLNLKDVIAAIREIQRVGNGKSYISVGAYRTAEERDLFHDWTVLGTTVLHVDEWLEVFSHCGYTGDYSFTTAATLHLVRS